MHSKHSRIALLCALIFITLFFTGWVKAQSVNQIHTNNIVESEFAPWEWQHPKPQGSPLESIDCPDVETCIIVGGGFGSPPIAFTLKNSSSSDWQVQSIDGSRFNQIDCISKNICYAASNDGHVQKTVNSGGVWELFTTNTNEDLNSIHCISPLNCIAVGDRGTIQRTTDGGQTWITATPDQVGDLNGVACLTSSICVAVGGNIYEGRILKSSNGGITWTTILTSTPGLTAITCSTENMCIAVGYKGLVYFTENGGLSWYKTSTHTTYGLLTDIECSFEDKCFATSFHGEIFHTQNGFNWFKQTILQDLNLNDISCPTKNDCTVIGAKGYLATTNNAGREWTNITQGNLTGETLWVCYRDGNFCRRESIDQVNDIDCSSDGQCIAVGNYGLILIGNLLTQHWERFDIVTEQNLHEISCINDTTCLISGSGGNIWKTTNRGTSWLAKSTNITKRLYGITCDSLGTCYAVGEHGSLLKSIDFGENWTSKDSQTNKDLIAIQCPLSYKCYAIADGDEVRLTINGGSSWTTLSVPINRSDELKSIYCSTGSQCLVVSNHNVYRTSDSGNTWSRSNFDEYLTDVSCDPSGKCVLSTSFGHAFHSNDYGATWHQEDFLLPYLSNAHCFSHGCVVVGDGASIVSSITWPKLHIEHSLVGSSFSHQSSLTGTIKVANSGTFSATQITVSNTLPANLIGDGPINVQWANQQQDIDSPTWPNLIDGLDITLLSGEELLIEYPVKIQNSSNSPLHATSQIIVNSPELPQSMQTDTTITLASEKGFLPIITTTDTIGCYGPFTDDFQNPLSGWPSGGSSKSTYSYINGEYSIYHKDAGRWFGATKNDYWTHGDHIIEVEGYQASGIGLVGLLFGLSSNEFYTFEIVPQLQKWYVFHYQNGAGWSTVASGETANIKSNNGKNHLLIQGVDSIMHFAVNYEWVYEMTEKPGFIGFTGASLEENTRLFYDNYAFQSQNCSVIYRKFDSTPNSLLEKIDTRTTPLN